MSPQSPVGTSSAGTPAHAGVPGKNNTTTSAFGSPRPTLTAGSTSSPFGRGIFDALPAVEPLKNSVFGSTFSNTAGGTSLVGHPMAFGAAPGTKRPLVTTGTSTPAYSVRYEKDPVNPNITLEYQFITAMPAYENMSLEELRMQDYQQNRKGAGTSGQTSSEAPVIFGKPVVTGQSKTGLVFGGGTAGASGTGTTQSASGPFGTFGREQDITGTGTGTGAFPIRNLKSRTSLTAPIVAASRERNAIGTSTSGQLSGPVLDHGKLERIEELLRTSLLGEEVVNTQFHLFSARSLKSGRVMKPRVLCANNSLLAKSSKYFLDLLSSDVNPSDCSLMDLTGDNDVPDIVEIDDYGYESDSDLDDYDDPTPVTNPEAPKNQLAMSIVDPASKPKDGNESSKGDHESSGSDAFVGSPKQTSTETQLTVSSGKVTTGNEESEKQPGMRLRSLGSRHILVKDTAFQTWYTLLNYLYTGKYTFLPLSSTVSGRQRGSSTSPLDGPRCSAKSMYRLASNVGLEYLRYQALAHIRSNLTEHNILKELSCRLLLKHPELLEMELDTLYFYIASPPVVANFSGFAQRIAKELPHGGDIIYGIYTRFLKGHYTFALKPVAAALPFGSSGLPERVVPGVNAGEAGAESKSEDENKTGSVPMDKGVTQAGSLPSGSSGSTPIVSPKVSVTVSVPTAPSTKEHDAGGKEATGKHM